MPAFVGFFIAVVIVLCLAILVFVGRSLLGLVRRVRDARRRRSVTDAPDGGDLVEPPGQDAASARPERRTESVTPVGAPDGDGPVYICPQLHATWQERGNCPECDQRGVPLGG